MAIDFSMELTGLAELHRRLEVFPGRVHRRAVRKSMTAPTTPIVREARRRAKALINSDAAIDRRGGRRLVRDSNLIRSIGRVVRTYRTGNVVTVIGPRHPQGAHGHLFEAGTAERPHPITGTSGRMPAQPFLGPAFRSNKFRVLAAIRRRLEQEIEVEAQKLRHVA